jgi:hypothetical protein
MSDKAAFFASYGSKKHIDHAFRVSNNPDTFAQELALQHNPLITREHVLLGMKSENEYVRRSAYTHPLATDAELRAGFAKDPIDNNKWYYKKELNRRERQRTVLDPNTGECGRCGSKPGHRDATCASCSDLK